MLALLILPGFLTTWAYWIYYNRMAKWNCFTGDGAFAGVVHAESKDDAIKEATAEFEVVISHVEEREEIVEPKGHG